MDRQNFCSECEDLRRRKPENFHSHRPSSTMNFGSLTVWFRLFFISQLMALVLGAGKVHIFLLKYDNQDGLLEDGTPCPTGKNFASVGPGVCRVRLHVCLQSFKARLPPLKDINVESCPYGSARTQILDQAHCRSIIESRERFDPSLPAFCAQTHVDFSFSWVGSLTAIFELRHHDTTTGQDHVIQRWAEPMRLSPDDGFRQITPNVDDNIHTKFAIGVNCSRGFFGPSCHVSCTPRNDNNGHYTCSETGSRTCLPGWDGERCTEPVCSNGCTNGKCVAPNKCRCEPGWDGENCDQCIPYQGCLHGTCEKPFECNCEPRWGGLQCDLDRDYCLHNQPCKNDAICVPDRPNNYTCICPPGYAGRDCELKVSPCYKNPCHHFGTCFVKEGDNQYECLCPDAYTGKHCELIRLDKNRYPALTRETSSAQTPYANSVSERVKVKEPCFYQGEHYPHGTRWDTMDCRQCTCVDTAVNCTRAACMAEDCLQNNRGCPPQQLCQSVQSGLCLKEPCRFPVGQCKPWQLADPGGFPELCRDRLDLGERTTECSRFFVRLDQDRLPKGSSVETVCFHVTLWLLTKQMEHFTSACRLKMEVPQLWMEIDLAAIKPRWPVTGLKEHLMSVLRQNLTISPILRAVTEVSHDDTASSSSGPWSMNQGGLGTLGTNDLQDLEDPPALIYFGIAACLLVIILILCMVIFVLHRKLRRSHAAEQNLDSSFGSTAPFGLREKSLSLSTVASVKQQKLQSDGAEKTAHIRWNNLSPLGAGVNACETFTGLVLPRSNSGRPVKECNLWKCHQERETGLETGLGLKEPAFEMEEKREGRTVVPVRLMRIVARQPGHQTEAVVSKEAVV